MSGIDDSGQAYTRHTKVRAIFLGFILIINLFIVGLTVSTITNAHNRTLDAKSETVTIDSNYTYNLQTGTFPTSNTLTQSTATIYLPTDWGAVHLYNSHWFIRFIWLDDFKLPGNIWDSFCEYWYDNATTKNGRIFNAYWGNWFSLVNNSEVCVVQKYAEAPHYYSGTTAEWNITIRVSILKSQPVIRVDGWLKNKNASSVIDSINWGLGKYEDAGCTWTLACSQWGYHEDDLGRFAVGHKGLYLNWDTSPSARMAEHSYNQLKYNTSKVHHVAAYFLIADNVNELEDLNEALDGTHNEYVPLLAQNLLVAYNSERFDTFSFFINTYDYIPSGTTETILVNGVSSTQTFHEGVILNYAKHPVMFTIGDTPQSSANETYSWIMKAARRYSIAIDFRVCFILIDEAECGWLYNRTLERGGTLFEIADHGWDHDYGDGASVTTYIENANTMWESVTGERLLVSQMPSGIYMNDTLERLVDAGIVAMGLTIYSNDMDELRYRDGNLTSNSGLSWAYTEGTGVKTSSQYAIMSLRAENYGFISHDSHDSDYYGTANKATADAYWSWLENQTDLISVTFGQFYDLREGNLKYYALDGIGTIDLTDCITNHRVHLAEDENGAIPLYYDVESGECAGVCQVKGDVASILLVKGHTYQEVARVAISDIESSDTVQFSVTSINQLEWEVNSTTSSVRMHYVISHLDNSVGYKVFQDGDEVFRQRTGYSILSFSVVDDGEFAVRVWSPYAEFGEYAFMLLCAGMIIGIGAIFFQMFNRYRR